MILYAALDVAIEKTALCIVDREGAVVLETNVASDPDALATHLAPYHLKLARLGLEAGPLSEWLVRGLERHGFRAVLMETRHVRAALSARIAKTDRKDARGMADDVAPVIPSLIIGLCAPYGPWWTGLQTRSG